MSDGLLLRGLEGSNPLAFLAALGTLRTLTLALPNEKVRMSWQKHEGAWRPRVICSLNNDGDAIVNRSEVQLQKAIDCSAFDIGDNLNLLAQDFRQHLCSNVNAIADLSDRVARVNVDFLAAFGSEAITDDNKLMSDTALRTMSGAGHQHFLKFIREIVANTNSSHLRRALLHHWDYADEGRGMNLRWDPADDRRYALRWANPSTDPNKTMRGANRLAIEALPLLPTIPAGRTLATTAFEGAGAKGTFFIWPIWTTPVVMDVVGSLLLAVPDIKRNLNRANHLGVAALYTSARITTGKFRNFTPGQPI